MKRFWKRIRSYVKGFLLLVVLVVLFSYAMFQGGFVSWFLFYSVSSCIVCTGLVTLFPFRIEGVERTMSKSVLSSGEEANVIVTIRKKRWHPFFYVRVKDTLPEGLNDVREGEALFFYSFQEKLTFSYTLKLERGMYEFEHVAVVFGDLFGLFERQVTLSSPGSVLVYPAIHEIKELTLEGGLSRTEGGQAQHLHQDHVILAGVREYVPGDRLTSIDWKQSARSSRLMTKEFESYDEELILVAFDSYVDKKAADLFEKSVELATSLMMMVGKEKSSVGVAIWSNDWLFTQMNARSLIRGLRQFAQVEPNQKEVPSVPNIYQQWQGMRVFYVCSELNSSVVRACQTMIGQNALVVIWMYSLSEYDRIFEKELMKIGVRVHVQTK